MSSRYKRSKRIKRRKSLSASNAAPIIAFLSTILGVLLVLALVVFVGLPRLLPLVGVEYHMPWQATPTPQPTARPTQSPKPIMITDPVDLQHEVLLPGGNEYTAYRWFADPYAFGNRLVFVAGRLIDSDIHMDSLFSFDMNGNIATKINAQKENRDYVYPVFNDTWLVYLDSKSNGGGAIRAMRWDTGETKVVKTVYTGQPRLHLSGNTLAWTERTGSRMDKIFVCDLITMENTTPVAFNNTSYGQSNISLSKDELLYAFEDPKSNETPANALGTSALYSLNILTGTGKTYSPGTYVHDPLTNGNYWVWRDGLHGENNNLYIAKNQSTARKIADNIIDYGLSDTFVAYSKNNEPIKVFLFDNEQEISITPEIERERTQLMGVSNGVVIWMDITSRERDVMKYARID